MAYRGCEEYVEKNWNGKCQKPPIYKVTVDGDPRFFCETHAKWYKDNGYKNEKLS